MFSPGIEKLLSAFVHNRHDRIDVMGGATAVTGQDDGCQPDLEFLAVFPDVDMGWLATIKAAEQE